MANQQPYEGKSPWISPEAPLKQRKENSLLKDLKQRKKGDIFSLFEKDYHLVKDYTTCRWKNMCFLCGEAGKMETCKTPCKCPIFCRKCANWAQETHPNSECIICGAASVGDSTNYEEFRRYCRDCNGEMVILYYKIPCKCLKEKCLDCINNERVKMIGVENDECPNCEVQVTDDAMMEGGSVEEKIKELASVIPYSGCVDCGEGECLMKILQALPAEAEAIAETRPGECVMKTLRKMASEAAAAEAEAAETRSGN